MTIWNPVIQNDDSPLYIALADAIAHAVRSGELAPGQRLPTQRALAERLGVALTTVTRGYAEAERRGLVSGQVGRGTYVSDAAAARSDDEARPVDLRPNTLLPLPFMPELSESIAALVREPGTVELFEYGPHAGCVRHREAGAGWLARQGLEASGDRVLVTCGAQHAMAVALAAVTEPGDVVLVEEVTYTGMRSLAAHLGIRLQALPLDGEGIDADALESACRERAPAALYCMPTLQNPTSAVMSERRRREVAEVANAMDLVLVEDDSYGYLRPEPTRLSAMCERAFYITGTSKSLLPGLRIGYVWVPAADIDRVEARIAATAYLASPVMAEVATRWIDDGTAERVMAWKAEEARARQKMAAEMLAGWDYRAAPDSPHGWLSLPEPWSGRDFARQAEERGVRVTPADVFAVARDRVPHAARVCVGAARSRGSLTRGLRALAATLAAGPDPMEVVV